MGKKWKKLLILRRRQAEQTVAEAPAPAVVEEPVVEQPEPEPVKKKTAKKTAKKKNAHKKKTK
mgnify:CR=1 FL=1